MEHNVQDGRDATARARAGGEARRRPIRYDTETWLVMRDDPVLPAAIIRRLQNPDGGEFFITVTWDLDPASRRLVGRYRSLEEADHVVLYERASPVVATPGEELGALYKRQEQQARQLERDKADRVKLYGP
jgi:hypothetical protein